VNSSGALKESKQPKYELIKVCNVGFMTNTIILLRIVIMYLACQASKASGSQESLKL
jgi:hypothetical protein